MKQTPGEGGYFVPYPLLTPEESGVALHIIQKCREAGGDQHKFLDIAKVVEAYCREERILLEKNQEKDLLQVIRNELQGLGPLTPLLQDASIEEITLTGVGDHHPVRVYVSGKGWKETNLFFREDGWVKGLVNRMARESGRRLTLQTPQLNAVLADGSRLHAAMQPLTLEGIVVTIRKFRVQLRSPQALLSQGSAPASFFALMELAFQGEGAALVCGNTGSGKTTLLNALFHLVPATERIIVVEETPELCLPHPHQIRLYSNPSQGITMQQLITETLRMRPDRVVVGEIRTPDEAGAFADTLRAGQGKGSYATFHARSGKEALSRLTSMGIPEGDLTTIELLILQKRWTQYHPTTQKPVEIRKVTEVCEVGMEEETPVLHPVFTYDYEQNRLVQKKPPHLILEKAAQAHQRTRMEMREIWKHKSREWERKGRPNHELAQVG